jgi:Ras-related protein Rab-40
MEAEIYAERNSMGFFEVSPLVNFNISESFVELARMALKRNGMERLWRSNKGLHFMSLLALPKVLKGEKKKCCSNECEI